MDIEALKERLLTTHTSTLEGTELLYAYRDLIDEILTTYQLLLATPATAPHAALVLPILATDYTEKIERASRLTLRDSVHTLSQSFSPGEAKPHTKLVNPPPDEDELLAQLIFFRHLRGSWQQHSDSIKTHLDLQQKIDLVRALFQEPIPIPELDFIQYTFESWEPWPIINALHATDLPVLLSDLTTINGPCTPEAVLESSLHGEFIRCLKRQLQIIDQAAAQAPVLAHHLIPQAYYQHLLCTVTVNTMHKLPTTLHEAVWEAIRKVHPSIYQGVLKKVI